MHWVDIHCHLDMIENHKDAVNKAKELGVEQMITISTTPDTLKTVQSLSKQYAPNVFYTLGIHPHDAKDFDLASKNYILENANNTCCVAIGEIGLDYYYEYSDRIIQRQVFEDQLNIASDMNLPIQIHTRDAEKDTIDILKKFDGKIKGVIHCFTGTKWLAEEAMALGMNISFSGIVTFKNANNLVDIAKSVPLDRIHIETDAPFLAPVPVRGKKNSPAFLIHVGEFLAKIKEINVEKFKQQLYKNAFDTFPKLNITK